MKNEIKDISLFRRILIEARPYGLKILVFFLLSLLSTPLALLSPVPLKIVVDNVIGSQKLPGWISYFISNSVQDSQTIILVFAVILFILIKLFSSLQSIYSESILKTKITENLLLDFRSRMLNHSQQLPIGFHDSKGTAYSSYRIHYDALAIQNIIFNTIIPSITSIVTFFSMLYVMFLLDKGLALIAIIISPIIFVIAFYFKQPLRKNWRSYKRSNYSSLAIINEVLSMMRVIKIFGRESLEAERFRSSSKNAIATRMKVEYLQGGASLLMNMATAGGTVLVLFIGTTHVLAGTLSLGNLLIVMSYLSQLYGPLKSIGSKVARLQAYLTSAERAYSLLEESVEVPESPEALSVVHVDGQIEFKNVSFSYDEREKILKNVSFEIKPGMKVGIAGRTGAGKTTLTNLLFRFYDPDEGRILLDGKDLRDYKVEDLRRQFSLVLQDSILFSGTIKENIAYGDVHATEEDIIQAAKVANAHNFIQDLPDGYDTKVGEKGMSLSGGERQRIALARSFIADAPILVLDEPTSSVDTKTEAVIVESMERIMKGKTTLIIAHRLSTLESCDLLLVIEDGRIVQKTSKVSETIREAILSGGLSVNVKGEIIDQ